MHGDIKPENIFLSDIPERNPYPKVVLGDFGLARFKHTLSRDPGRIHGTEGYQPPERVWSCKGDVYSLGTTMHVLANGRLPYANGVHYEHILSPPFSSGLRKLVLDCCLPSPQHRLSTMRLMDRFKIMSPRTVIQHPNMPRYNNEMSGQNVPQGTPTGLVDPRRNPGPPTMPHVSTFEQQQHMFEDEESDSSNFEDSHGYRDSQSRSTASLNKSHQPPAEGGIPKRPRVPPPLPSESVLNPSTFREHTCPPVASRAPERRPRSPTGPSSIQKSSGHGRPPASISRDSSQKELLSTTTTSYRCRDRNDPNERIKEGINQRGPRNEERTRYEYAKSKDLNTSDNRGRSDRDDFGNATRDSRLANQGLRSSHHESSQNSQRGRSDAHNINSFSSHRANDRDTVLQPSVVPI